MVDPKARLVVERRHETRFGMELDGIAWRAEPPWQYVRGNTVNMSRNGLAFLIRREEASAFAAGDAIRFRIGVCTDLLRHSEAILEGGGTVVRVQPLTGVPDKFLLAVRTRMTHLTRLPQVDGDQIGPDQPSGREVR